MTRTLLALLLVSAAAAAEETPTVTPAEAPAAGRHEARLTVPAFGRYAVRVKSEEGVQLRLVDRMAGPGPIDGSPGEQDGRLDLFLERGETRVVATGHERAKGSAKLEVLPFREQHADPPQLVELKAIDTTLEDLQQRSYWIHLPERRTVVVEAAGRSLGDLRLWRDGAWLVAAEPERERTQPRPGKPLDAFRLAATLEPGLYLLTAYGGPALPWAEENGAHPLHLRAGLPELPVAGRRRFETSPFGIDRYRVPGAATYLRAELAEARPLALGARTLDLEQPFVAPQEAAAIDKTSIPPAAELLLAAQQEDRVVTVSGEAGQPYVLQQFPLVNEWVTVPPGSGWISTLQSGAPTDSFDATAVLSQVSGSRAVLVGQDVVDLARGPWVRRANVLGLARVLLSLPEAGEYEVRTDGVRVEARLEPFFVTPPAEYKAPALKPSPSLWSLEKALHVLTLEPREKGIVTVQVRRRSLGAVTAEAIGRRLDPAPARAAARLTGPPGGATLHLGRQEGVRQGVVTRKLPLDLREALFVAVSPGETVTVPFAASEPGVVEAVAEDGSRVPVSIDGAVADRAEPGVHQLELRNDSAQVKLVSVAFVPERLRREAPLPPLPADVSRVATFPLLQPGTEVPLDLDREQSATFALRVDEAGLYELSTTGILATAGEIRTRTNPRLDGAQENGVGRNLSMRQYLREGDYQVTVRTVGQTRGHLGVRVDKTPLLNGGFLTNGLPARVTLAPGQGIAYRFNITKPGRFQIRALGLGRTFRMRLESLDGWPLRTPGAVADVTEDLGPGRYRVIVLPEATEARVLTLIEPVPAPVSIAGHGPHRLRLGSRRHHLWTEPEAGGVRVPDVWELDVPAPVDASIELTGEMQADLLRDGAKVGFVPPERGWKGRLEAGTYRLEVVGARVNNRAPYSVAVWTEQLVEGQRRETRGTADIPVSIGTAGVFEIATFGDMDVAARLFDAQGRLLASGDDRPHDWNAHLSVRLDPGLYRLRIEPVGTSSGQTRVSLRRPAEREEPARGEGAFETRLGQAALVWPLQLGGSPDVIQVQASAGETVGLALEAQVAGAWREIGADTGRKPRVAVATGPEATSWRLRAWSLDRRESSVRVEVMTRGAQRIAVDRPGVFRVPEGVRACARRLAACATSTLPVAVTGREMWLLGGPADRAERIVLQPGRPITVATTGGEPMVVDVAAARGPRLLHVTARDGQPGASFGEARDTFGVQDGAAWAATLGAESSARVWAADRRDPLEVRLELHAFAEPAARAELRDGALDGEVAAGQSLAVDLGGGKRRVELALGEQTFGVLARKDEVRRVFGAAAATSLSVDTEADRLVVLGLAPGRFAVRTTRTEPVPLQPGAPYEADLAAAGRRVLAVEASAGTPLHVRGTSARAIFVGRDGTVLQGTDLVASGPGTLHVTHDPGLLLAWLGQDAPWGAEAPGSAKTLDIPGSVRLEGQVQSVSFDLKAPGLLHLRSTSRAAVMLQRPNAPVDARLLADGLQLDVYVPAGRTTLTLRGVGGTLHGTLDVTATPVTVVTEGLGPEVLLEPGVARLFAFEVDTERQLGVGVRASADSVDAVLMNAAGTVLGRGASQMQLLKPGRYLVSLVARPDGPTVRARLALLGLVPPDTGPPPDVARGYVQPVDVELPNVFTATPRGTPWGQEAIADEEMDGEIEEGEEQAVDEPADEDIGEDEPTEEEPEAEEAGEQAEEGGPGGAEERLRHASHRRYPPASARRLARRPEGAEASGGRRINEGDHQ
jgi:hypothetical protein